MIHTLEKKKFLARIIVGIYLRDDKFEHAKDVMKKGHFWVLTCPPTEDIACPHEKQIQTLLCS